MSNLVTIEPTKFTNIRSGKETIGIRMYDEYGQFYDDTMQAVPKDDLVLFQMIMEDVTDDDSEIANMLVSSIHLQKGIEIGGTYYEQDELRKASDKFDKLAKLHLRR